VRHPSPALAASIVFRMSILVVQLVREGLLLGADRNVTTTVTQGTMIASAGLAGEFQGH
jgi:hypothetical protein